MKQKKKGGGVAVTGVALIALLAVLFGKGKLGFGDGFGFGKGFGSGDGFGSNEGVEESNTEGASVTDLVQEENTEDENSENVNAIEGSFEISPVIEIRIQGREYNYENISYGNNEHTIEDLLAELDSFDRNTRIDLIVEDNATKNAVDDLQAHLVDAGFTDIHK